MNKYIYKNRITGKYKTDTKEDTSFISKAEIYDENTHYIEAMISNLLNTISIQVEQYENRRKYDRINYQEELLHIRNEKLNKLNIN